jgi:hypothetical protein
LLRLIHLNALLIVVKNPGYLALSLLLASLPWF